MNLSEIGEFGLIERLHKQLETRGGVHLGIGDDCAVLESLECPVITMDALVEGVHFRRDWTTPRALGRKSMAVNISDLAASGARPVAAFVSLAVGQSDSIEWIEELYQGFEDMARRYNFTVAGGDTVKSLGGTMISVALIGESMNVARGPILRSGAQPGDVLMVSGTLGDSAAGLNLLLNPHSSTTPSVSNEVLLRHHEPTPRLEAMRWLLETNANAVHAALDISDGIMGDAAHMAKRSALQIEIDVERLPISPASREVAWALGKDETEWALTGGEDYELLLAVAPEFAAKLAEGVPSLTLIAIGTCSPSGAAGPGISLRNRGVVRDAAAAWTHF
jgi:thiamine-monophosphate kinase